MYRKYCDSLFNIRYSYRGKKYRDAPVHQCIVAGLIVQFLFCLSIFHKLFGCCCFFNFFSASAGLTVNFNLCNSFVQQFNFLYLVLSCTILPNLLYKQSYFLNSFHGHHSIEEFRMHSGIAVDCCDLWRVVNDRFRSL